MRRKPPSRRQNRATRDLALVPRNERDAPPAPDTLPPALKAEWHTLWDSPLAAAWSPDTDARIVARLFSLYALRGDALQAIEEDGMIVAGSKGQPVDHPLARRMSDMDTEIRQLEDRLGLNPKARLNLGLEGLRVQAGLAGLSRVDEDEMDDSDPRMEVVK